MAATSVSSVASDCGKALALRLICAREIIRPRYVWARHPTRRAWHLKRTPTQSSGSPYSTLHVRCRTLRQGEAAESKPLDNHDEFPRHEAYLNTRRPLQKWNLNSI